MLRPSLICAALVLIWSPVALANKVTTDPNLAGAAAKPVAEKPDLRLAQKISYTVRLKPMTTILQDLAEKTGVKLIAGKTADDWRVREEIATVCAADLPLSQLMDALAKATKFAWTRSGEEPDWTYRLVESRAAIREAEKRKAAHITQQSAKRKRVLDQLLAPGAMDADRMAGLREKNPQLYLSWLKGEAAPAAEFLRAAPEVVQAWLACRDAKIPISRLSQEAQAALLSYGRRAVGAYARSGLSDSEISEYMEDVENRLRRGMVEVVGGSPANAFGSIRIPELGSLSLREPLNERDRLIGMAFLRSYEEQRGLRDVRAEMGQQFEILPAPDYDYARQPWNYTMEEIRSVADEPWLHEKLKKKMESQSISGLVVELAKATGLAVVTDDFRGKTRFAADEKREIGEVIQQVADLRTMNWQRQGDVIVVWNRDWYERRASRVSQEWLAQLRGRMEKNSTLDIDDLAAAALLTDAQIQRNITRDKVLGCVSGTLWQRRDYLRFYASLSPAQRSMLLSEDGISFAALTEHQIESALNLAGSVDASLPDGVDIAAVGLRIAATRSRPVKAFVYKLRAWTDLGPIPGDFTFRTPVYVPPPPEPPPLPTATVATKDSPN